MYPWVLSDVVAGRPKLLRPFVDEAKYAAELRNHYWQTMRAAKGANGKITLAAHQSPYPAVKTDQCSDRAEDDGGGNFGRVARYGLLDEFVKSVERQEASGIPIKAWLTFFKIFSDNAGNLNTVVAAIEGALHRYTDLGTAEKTALVECFERIVSTLKGEGR